MKIVLFYTPPIEKINVYTRILIEIIENELNQKNQISLIICKGRKGLNKCVANFRGDRSKCYVCNTGLNILRSKYSKNPNINFTSYSEGEIKRKDLKIRSIHDLKNLTYLGINIGLAIHSSIITTFRDHVYDIDSKLDFIRNSYLSSAKTIDVLMKINPDHVYSFNGRVSHYNSIIKYAIFKNIGYSIFEIPANKNKYTLLKNRPLHSLVTYSREIERVWKQSNLSAKNKEIQAKNFFKLNSGRLKSKDYQITVFSKDKLPKSKKYASLKTSSKRIVSIFNSSRNEFECIEGWNEDLFYDDDENLINKICEYFKTNKDFLFVLRVHPNLKYLKNTQNKNIRKLEKNKNLVIIYPEEKISSYELIRLSETIITFGSTIGVEATFMGKKSISIGDSLYKKLNCTYNPKSFPELVYQIQNKDLENKPEKSTFKYGFYILNNGKNFRLSKKVYVHNNSMILLCLRALNIHKYIRYSNLKDTYSNLKRKLI